MSNMFGPPPGVSAALPAQSVNPMPQNPTVQMDDRVTVGPCIISYPALLVPRKKMNGEELEYSGEFLVLMETPEQQGVAQQIWTRMMTLANAVSQAKFQRNADTFMHKPIRDIKERKGFEQRNGFFFSAKSGTQYKPTALIGNPPVQATDPDQIYAGAIVYCTVRAGAYDQGGNKGIKWYLNSVLKVGDGPRLAGDHNAVDDYADVLATMPITQPVAPSYQAPPSFGPPGYPVPPQAPGQYEQPYQPSPGYQGYVQPTATPMMPGYRG